MSTSQLVLVFQTLKHVNSANNDKPDDVIDREELRQAMIHAMVSDKFIDSSVATLLSLLLLY